MLAMFRNHEQRNLDPWLHEGANQALEALSNAYCEKKKYYIAANDYAMAKIEDVLALEEGDPEE